MKLRLLKDLSIGYKTYQKGNIIKYEPWNFYWHGMNEPDRIKKGIFVFCNGHGCFDILEKDIDIEIVGEKKYR